MANKYKNKDIIDNSLAKEFGKDYIKILIAFLKKFKKIASGALINSLNSRVQSTAKDIQVFIESNDYLKYVDEGRKAGKYPPIQAISRWAQLKGIPQRAVFPIARSIFKHGIKPTNVIQLTTKEFETSPSLTNKYEGNIAQKIEDKIFTDYINELEKDN
ncbi:MAG: hypothetical protein GY870_06695 [archaeon]|nr:hypothetical protein [archaeon]